MEVCMVSTYIHHITLQFHPTALHASVHAGCQGSIHWLCTKANYIIMILSTYVYLQCCTDSAVVGADCTRQITWVSFDQACAQNQIKCPHFWSVTQTCTREVLSCAPAIPAVIAAHTYTSFLLYVQCDHVCGRLNTIQDMKTESLHNQHYKQWEQV